LSRFEWRLKLRIDLTMAVGRSLWEMPGQWRRSIPSDPLELGDQLARAKRTELGSPSQIQSVASLSENSFGWQQECDCQTSTQHLSTAMLARCAPRCVSKLRLPISRSCPRVNTVQCRRFSMPSTGAPQGAATSSAGMLAPFVNELDKIAPSFKIDGSQIRVLQTPTEFYETLKDKIRTAERRIFLSTLYIGKSEKELVRSVLPPPLSQLPPD